MLGISLNEAVFGLIPAILVGIGLIKLTDKFVPEEDNDE